MTASEIWSIVAGVIVSLGGSGVIIVGLSNWLGKLWANRYIESERTRHAQDLEKIKTELIKTVHVHKGQFDTEFNAYREIWKTLSEVKYAVLALRPWLDKIDPTESEEVTKQKRLKEFVDKYNAFFYTMDQSRPFYSDSVWKALKEVSSIMRSEAIDYEVLHKFDKGYWEKAHENEEKLVAKIDELCVAIRERINSLTIVG